MTALTDAAIVVLAVATSHLLTFIFGWGVGSGRITPPDDSKRTDRW